jgi:hypothetical protein
MTTVAEVESGRSLGLIEPGQEWDHWLVPPDYEGLKDTAANFDKICPEIDRPRAVRLGMVGLGELVQHHETNGDVAQITRSILVPTEQQGVRRVYSILEPLNGNFAGAFFGNVHLARFIADKVQTHDVRTLSVNEYKIFFGPIRRGITAKH